MRDRDQTQRAVAACRAALDTHGLLLVQDATLASITTLTVGEPVRGSWWGHELAHTIFDVIATLEAEVAVVKLVDKKQTLVHERLWPAIVGIGAARSKPTASRPPRCVGGWKPRRDRRAVWRRRWRGAIWCGRI